MHGGGDARSAMAGGCCEHGAARGEGEREKWSGDLVGQALGCFLTPLAMPGSPRRMACVHRRAATGGATRRQFSESVGHNVH